MISIMATRIWPKPPRATARAAIWTSKSFSHQPMSTYINVNVVMPKHSRPRGAGLPKVMVDSPMLFSRAFERKATSIGDDEKIGSSFYGVLEYASCQSCKPSTIEMRSLMQTVVLKLTCTHFLQASTRVLRV